MKRAALVFAAVAAAACVPIWAVRYFIVQDGSGHVHAAWMMFKLLEGDPQAAALFKFNFILFPDVLGHWLLALLLLVVSPFVATKLMMTLTYVGLVAAVVWLRWATRGDGLVMSTLIGGALAYNSLWLVGFFNFNIGLIIAVFAVGLYFRWRDELSLPRVTLLAVLFFTVFVSHIVGFAILSGAIGVLAILPWSRAAIRRVAWTAAAFIPTAPAAIIYKFSTEAGGKFTPIWRSLNGASPSELIAQLRGVDSFIIISRQSFPFLDIRSAAFAVFTPLLWIVIALAALGIASWLYRKSSGTFDGKLLPFIVLAAGFLLVSLISPDDFQFTTSTGGVLRERIFLGGLIFLVPLPEACISKPIKRLALAAFVFVIIYQSAALWEYSLRSDRMAKEYFSAAAEVPDGTTLAAVTIITDGTRFSANPLSSMDNYIGIGRNVFIWDNYEFGHYLFPLVTRNKSDERFALLYTGGNTYALNDPNSFSDERLDRLRSALAEGSGRIETLLVSGSDPRVESVVAPYFGSTPYYSSGEIRLFRHR